MSGTAASEKELVFLEWLTKHGAVLNKLRWPAVDQSTGSRGAIAVDNIEVCGCQKDRCYLPFISHWLLHSWLLILLLCNLPLEWRYNAGDPREVDDDPSWCIFGPWCGVNTTWQPTSVKRCRACSIYTAVFRLRLSKIAHQDCWIFRRFVDHCLFDAWEKEERVFFLFPISEYTPRVKQFVRMEWWWVDVAAGTALRVMRHTECCTVRICYLYISVLIGFLVL